MFLPGGKFRVYPLTPTGWTHILLNYIGPNDGEGMWIYYNGMVVGRHTTKGGGPYPAGDGSIVVGRCYTDQDRYYATAQVDELIFNRHLTLDEIAALATAT